MSQKAGTCCVVLGVSTQKAGTCYGVLGGATHKAGTCYGVPVALKKFLCGFVMKPAGGVWSGKL